MAGRPLILEPGESTEKLIVFEESMMADAGSVTIQEQRIIGAIVELRRMAQEMQNRVDEDKKEGRLPVAVSRQSEVYRLLSRAQELEKSLRDRG